MDNIYRIISDIENRWKDIALQEILKAAEEHNLDNIYVAGFCLFYVDGTEFFPPHIGLNTEHYNLEDRANGHNNRWWPCEWKISLQDAREIIFGDYEFLARALANKSNEVWDTAIEEHFRAIARVCKYLTSNIRMSGTPHFTQSFVAGIFEYQELESEYSRLARLSIDDDVLAKLADPRW